MTTPRSTVSSDRIAPAANALIETLHVEADVLEELDALYEQQLDVLRANDPEGLESLATKTQDRTATLDDLRQKAKRQTRLLGRVLDVDADDPSLRDTLEVLFDSQPVPEPAERLKEACTTVAEQVQAVNQRRETLRLALQYATELNHDLLVAMQAAATQGEGETYTAEGRPEDGPGDRSFVNTTG